MIGVGEAEVMARGKQQELFDAVDWRTGLWQGMPEFEQADKEPYHSIVFHFECEADVVALEVQLGYKLPRGQLKASAWYPEKKPERYADKRYIDEGWAE